MAFNVTYYEDHEPRTTEVLNRPISQIAAAIGDIYSRVGADYINSRTVVHSLPCSDTVAVGDIVCVFNRVLEKAKAVWASNYGTDGQLNLSEKSIPVGVLISKEGSEGDVLVQGLLNDSSIISLLNVDAPGMYYLSNDNEGKATKNIVTPSVSVFNVIDSSTVIVDINNINKDGHHHRHISISTNPAHWEANGDDPTYLYKYVGSTASSIFDYPTDSPSIFVDGILKSSEYKIITEDGTAILVAKELPEVESEVVLYLTVPAITDAPVVRAIETKGSNRLRSSSSNGVVTLTFDGIEDDPIIANAATAIHSYTDSGQTKVTPVVSAIRGGAGTSVTSEDNGKYVITAGYSESTPIYPSMLSLNGVSSVSLNGEIYYYFPARTDVGIVGIINLNPPADGMQYKVYPFVVALGHPSAFSGASFLVSGTMREVKVDELSGSSTEVPFGTPLSTVTISSVQVSKDHIKTVTGNPFTIHTGGVFSLYVKKTTSGEAYISSIGVVVVPEKA